MKGFDDIDELIKKRTGECASKCSNVIHCDAEARCLLDDSSSGTCPQTLPTPLASCGTLTYTTTTTSGAASCAAQCQEFENSCTASCSPVSSCGSMSSDQVRTVIGSVSMFIGMVSLSL
jgi:hypothetical protein